MYTDLKTEKLIRGPLTRPRHSGMIILPVNGRKNVWELGRVTYIHTYICTYLLTYSLHGAESLF